MVHIEGLGLNDVKLNTPPPSPPEESTSNGTADDCKMEAAGDREGGDDVNQKNVCTSGGIPEWLKSSLPRTSSVLHHSLEVVAPSTHGACPVEELLELKTEKTTKRVFEEGECAYVLFESMQSMQVNSALKIHQIFFFFQI